MKNSTLLKFAHEFIGILFFIRNIYATYRFSLSPIPSTNFNEFKITGLTKVQIPEFIHLFNIMRDESEFNLWWKHLLKYKSSTLCAIAVDEQNDIVGLQFFYFRKKEWKNGIIHEAYIGVSPVERGRGIATSLRKHMKKHFTDQGLAGISSRISKNNVSSLHSAEIVGFIPVKNSDESSDTYQLFIGLRHSK